MLNFNEAENKFSQLNETTIIAIKEGRCLAYDEEIKGYTEMDELKKSLEGREWLKQKLI